MKRLTPTKKKEQKNRKRKKKKNAFFENGEMYSVATAMFYSTLSIYKRSDHRKIHSTTNLSSCFYLER
jgi:hypothetical protein